MNSIVILMCLILLVELTENTYVIVIAMIMGVALTGSDITNLFLATLLFVLSATLLVCTRPDFPTALAKLHNRLRAVLSFWRRG